MPPKPYLQVAILLSRMGKRGIEPPMFTTWELIYSQPQHRQSLPLPRNARTPHSISLYATALRIQYQIGTIGTEGFEPSIRLSLLFSVYTPLLPIKLRSENRHAAVSNHIFRAMRCTILCDITGNRLVRICTSHNNDFPQRVTPLTGSFIALLIQ